MALTQRFAAQRTLLAWLLAALLLVAQGLGLGHRVAHAPGPGPAGVAAATHGHELGRARALAHRQAHASAFWGAGHEPDTPECRLVDQLGHADGLCGAAWAAAPAPLASAAAVAAPAAAPRAGSASAYLARAPPLG